MIRRFVAPAVFTFSLGYAFLTGPFRGADEFNHFFRAYQVSEGQILASHEPNGVVGARLPASLLVLASSAANFPAVPPVKTSLSQMSAAGRIPLQQSARTVINFPNTALYSPLVYLPAALGLALGRLVFQNALVLFYFSRSCNALCAAFLLVVATRTFPASLQTIGIAALLPMVLFQAGVISADSITLGVGFLFAALVLRTRCEPNQVTTADRLKLLLLAVALSQLRPPYPLIGLAVFAIRFDQFYSRWIARRFFGLFLALLVVPCVIWSGFIPALYSQMRPGTVTDPAGQFSLLLHAPLRFLAALGMEVGPKSPAHVRELLGYLGWRNFALPWPLITVFFVALLILVCSVDTTASQVSRKLRLHFLGIAIIGFIGANFMIYMMWNPVGAMEVEGFHGRYFLPFLPLLLVALCNASLLKIRWLIPWAVGAFLSGNLVALGLLARATFF